MQFLLYMFLIFSLELFALTKTCETSKFTLQNVTPSTQYIGSKLYCASILGNTWLNSPDTNPCKMASFKIVTSTITYTGTVPPCPNGDTVPQGYGRNACFIDVVNGVKTFKCNPKPADNISSSLHCDELFLSSTTGVAKTCDPNTNIATEIENSETVIVKEGVNVLKCKAGFEEDVVITMNPNVGISFNTFACIKSVEKEPVDIIITKDDGTIEETKIDGTKIVTSPNGNQSTTTPNGVETIRYPDGSSSIAGSYGTASGTTPSSSSSSSSATGGVTGSLSASELNGSDSLTSYVPVAAAQFCNDANMTLEQRSLCEINSGIKNLNAENDSQNSLTNVIKNLNNDNNINLDAINSNIRYTNDNLDLINKNTENANVNSQGAATSLKNIESTLDGIGAAIKGDEDYDPATISDPVTISEAAPNEFFDSFDSGSNLDLMDQMIEEFQTFVTNQKEEFDTLTGFLADSKAAIVERDFQFIVPEVTTCPVDYVFDLGRNHKVDFTIDYCKYTSYFYPIIYPLLVIGFNIALVFYSISLIVFLL